MDNSINKDNKMKIKKTCIIGVNKMTENENTENEEKLYPVMFADKEYMVTKDSILYHFHMMKKNIDNIKKLEDD